MKENLGRSPSTVDADEIAHFTAMADEWWDARGKFAPLHAMNPVRLAFIRDCLLAHFSHNAQSPRPLEGLSILDIGSGGGLLCEPLARMGAQVTGVDAAEKNIHIARLHAQQNGLEITYHHSTAETLAYDTHPLPQYDVVCALEIVEHVANVEAFLAAITRLVKPGGVLLMSTLNRTAKSYAMAILGAEYVLRWVPKGTHHWKKFLKPSELVLPLEQCGLTTQCMAGIAYDPLNARWYLDADNLEVNYILAATKPAHQ